MTLDFLGVIQPWAQMLVDEMWLSPDKLLHALACGSAALGLRLWLGRTSFVRRQLWLIVGLVLVLGISREVHDWWVGKYFSQKDMLWNLIGMTAGLWLAGLLSERRGLLARRKVSTP